MSEHYNWTDEDYQSAYDAAVQDREWSISEYEAAYSLRGEIIKTLIEQREQAKEKLTQVVDYIESSRRTSMVSAGYGGMYEREQSYAGCGCWISGFDGHVEHRKCIVLEMRKFLNG